MGKLASSTVFGQLRRNPPSNGLQLEASHVASPGITAGGATAFVPTLSDASAVRRKRRMKNEGTSTTCIYDGTTKTL